MDPDGDYESRHSMKSTAARGGDDVAVSPSSIFAPDGDAKPPAKMFCDEGTEVYDGPSAPPMEEAPSPARPAAAAAAATARGNAYNCGDKIDTTEPPPIVSSNVAVPIGFDSDDQALPEAKALPIVGSTATGGTKMSSAEDAEAQMMNQPTPIPVPFSQGNDNTPGDRRTAAPSSHQERHTGKTPQSQYQRRRKIFCIVLVSLVAIGIVLGVVLAATKQHSVHADEVEVGTTLTGYMYPNCHVNIPSLIGNGQCQGREYNTADCGWDGGDCLEFNEQYPDCHVNIPSFIGNGDCDNYGHYNTAACGWDGGDCLEFNGPFPDCNVDDGTKIGNGHCQGGMYNTAECGWDGGDCLVDGYPDCHVDNPIWIGDGDCHGGKYNTAECGWDGGDCSVPDWPNCHVDNPNGLGNGKCNNGSKANSIECGFDLGDCRNIDVGKLKDLVTKYPGCYFDGMDLSDIGDGYCHGGEYNTAECGWDGGDCIVDGYPDCHVDVPKCIGNGNCVNKGDYNTAECGWDGGDCLEFNEQYPDCHVDYPYFIGNGWCNNFGKYNTAECGWDGGDC